MIVSFKLRDKIHSIMSIMFSSQFTNVVYDAMQVDCMRIKVDDDDDDEAEGRVEMFSCIHISLLNI